MTREDAYPALIVGVVYGSGRAKHGTVSRIPYHKAPPKEWTELHRCQHHHRLMRAARECAAKTALAMVQP